jgi:hypothetical protein
MSAIDKAYEDTIRKRIERAREAIKIEETVQAVQDTVLSLRQKIVDNRFCTKEEAATAKALFDGAKLLLAKALPDLRAIEHSGEVQHKHSLEELVQKSMQVQGGVTPTVHRQVEH